VLNDPGVIDVENTPLVFSQLEPAKTMSTWKRKLHTDPESGVKIAAVWKWRIT